MCALPDQEYPLLPYPSRHIFYGVELSTTHVHVIMAHIDAQPEGALCGPCSLIDFELLQLPTAGQLRQLSNGYNITSKFPFKRNLDGSPTSWELGPMIRIQQSADNCSFCKAILQCFYDVEQVEERPLTLEMVCTAELNFRGTFRPGNTANMSPTVLEYMQINQPQALRFPFRSITLHWSDPTDNSHTLYRKRVYATDCLHVCDMLYYSEAAPGFYDDENLPDEKIILCSRLTSPRIQLEMVRAWMGECTSKHISHCGTILASRSVKHHQVLNSFGRLMIICTIKRIKQDAGF